MFIRKPKDLTTNKYWFFKHNKLEKEAKPAKYGCKRKYITKKNKYGHLIYMTIFNFFIIDLFLNHCS